jgi:hypothetical protein
MSAFLLTSRIIGLSASSNWDEARLEWDLVDVARDDDPQSCLCGHHPINELCTIRNRETQKTTVVGNCCVKKFLGLSSHKIFQAVARVQKEWWRALNAETIALAHRNRWINDWERGFYLDTMRKRELSGNQSRKRYEINTKILSRIVRRNTPPALAA